MRKTLFGLLLIPIFLDAKILEPHSFWDIQKISKPLINKQGTEIIFTKRRIDKQNDKFVSEIWIMKGDGENQGFFAKGSNDTKLESEKLAYVWFGIDKQAWRSHTLSSLSCKIPLLCFRCRWTTPTQASRPPARPCTTSR